MLNTVNNKAGILKRLSRIKGFVFDMDGTLALGDKRNKGLLPLPGALDITRWLKDHDIPFVIFTNGTTRTPDHYAETLRDAGFDIQSNQMMTPASSAADIFVRKGYKRVMVMGGEALAKPLADVGIEAVEPGDTSKVDAIMIGWFREFTMASIEAACTAVWDHGAEVYSASQVIFFATADGGRGFGTSRMISAVVRDLTGCKVNLVGKPSISAFGTAGRRMGLKLRDIAVVGDDPNLEVPMAHRGRGHAIAVNTGLANKDAYDHLPPSKQPHLIVDGIDELYELLKAARK